MATLTTKYLGHLRTEITHVQSGNTIITDAPLDNNGKGEFFSPTDITSASLGSCIFTIMAMVAERNGVDITGAELSTEKVMYTDPRRIGELKLHFTFPQSYDEKTVKLLERAAQTCPVYNSLHPDIKKEIIFNFK